MPETPAQKIRRAAALMRERAQAATRGPWRNHDGYVRDGGYVATVLTGEGNETRPVAWIPSFSNQPGDVDRQAWPDAIYIAAMHPGVVLLIADQWDAVADDMGDDEVVERGAAGVGVLVLGRIFAPRKPWTAALAAARAFLGEEA